MIHCSWAKIQQTLARSVKVVFLNFWINGQNWTSRRLGILAGNTGNTCVCVCVFSQTTRIEFDLPEYCVRRRYQDFDWLRIKLEDSQPTHLIPVGQMSHTAAHVMSCFSFRKRLIYPLCSASSPSSVSRHLQPLPEKFVMKGVVDRFSEEFVETRMKALDKFLKRVADHPVLSFNPHLNAFLSAKVRQTHGWDVQGHFVFLEELMSPFLTVTNTRTNSPSLWKLKTVASPSVRNTRWTVSASPVTCLYLAFCFTVRFKTTINRLWPPCVCFCVFMCVCVLYICHQSQILSVSSWDTRQDFIDPCGEMRLFQQ